MFNEIDARNLSCPQPVVFTKKALDDLVSGSLITIVNTKVALENVLTLVRTLGCQADVEQKGDDYYIRITKPGEHLECQEISTKNEVLVIASQFLGRGNDELGGVLTKAFFYTLMEGEEVPRTALFLNGGVKLACEGSPVLEYLMFLEKRGVEILSCGTCLDFFQIKEKLCVGQITNMYTIWDKINKADKVINF